MINKSLLLTETVDELSNYSAIKLMKQDYKKTLDLALQQTTAHLQLPILTSIIRSNSIEPYAVRLTKAQASRSVNYMFLEAWTRDDCREPEDKLFVVCPQTGGPLNIGDIAAAYSSARSAAAGSDESPHAAGVAAARAIAARRPADASSQGARGEGSDRAEDYGLAADVPGGWHLTSVLSCSCQMFTHHG